MSVLTHFWCGEPNWGTPGRYSGAALYRGYLPTGNSFQSRLSGLPPHGGGWHEPPGQSVPIGGRSTRAQGWHAWGDRGDSSSSGLTFVDSQSTPGGPRGTRRHCDSVLTRQHHLYYITSLLVVTNGESVDKPFNGTESAEATRTWAILAKARIQGRLPLSGADQAVMVLEMLDPEGQAIKAFLPKYDKWIEAQNAYIQAVREQAEILPQERDREYSQVLAVTEIGVAKTGKVGLLTPTTLAMLAFITERFGNTASSAAETVRQWSLDLADIVRSTYALRDANDQLPANARRPDAELAQTVLAKLAEETHRDLRILLAVQNNNQPIDRIVTLEQISLKVLVEKLQYLQRSGQPPKLREAPRAPQAVGVEARYARGAGSSRANAHAAPLKPSTSNRAARGGASRSGCKCCGDRRGSHAEEECFMRDAAAFAAAPIWYHQLHGTNYEAAKHAVADGTFYKSGRKATAASAVGQEDDVRARMQEMETRLTKLAEENAQLRAALVPKGAVEAATGACAVVPERSPVTAAPAKRVPSESRTTLVNGVPVPPGFAPLGPMPDRPVVAKRTGGTPTEDAPTLRAEGGEVTLQALGVEVVVRKPPEPTRRLAAASQGGAAFVRDLSCGRIAGTDLTGQRWLADTGSDLSFISKSVAARLRSAGVEFRECSVVVEGAVGAAPLEVRSVTTEVPVTMMDAKGGAATGSACFHVSDSPAFDVLIGTDLMTSLKMDVLFSRTEPTVVAQGCEWQLQPALASGCVVLTAAVGVVRQRKEAEAARKKAEAAELLRCAMNEEPLPGGGVARLRSSGCDPGGGRWHEVGIFDSDGELIALHRLADERVEEGVETEKHVIRSFTLTKGPAPRSQKRCDGDHGTPF